MPRVRALSLDERDRIFGIVRLELLKFTDAIEFRDLRA